MKKLLLTLFIGALIMSGLNVNLYAYDDLALFRKDILKSSDLRVIPKFMFKNDCYKKIRK